MWSFALRVTALRGPQQQGRPSHADHVPVVEPVGFAAVEFVAVHRNPVLGDAKVHHLDCVIVDGQLGSLVGDVRVRVEPNRGVVAGADHPAAIAGLFPSKKRVRLADLCAVHDHQLGHRGRVFGVPPDRGSVDLPGCTPLSECVVISRSASASSYNWAALSTYS
jgi:hypothetical protein